MNYTLLVEKYIHDELDPEARKDFEKELAVNPELRTELENAEALLRFMKEQHHRLSHKNELIEEEGPEEHHLSDEEQKELERLYIARKKGKSPDELHFMDQLKDSQKKFAEKGATGNRKIMINRYLFWSVAAAVVAVLAISSVITFNALRQNSYELLFTEYFEPVRTYMVTRSGSGRQNSELEKALFAYEQGNYAASVNLMEELNRQEGLKPEHQLIRGIALIKTGDYAGALQQLSYVGGDSLLIKYATWYKGLIYLKLQDKQKALECFNELQSGKDYFARMSKEVSEKLD